MVTWVTWYSQALTSCIRLAKTFLNSSGALPFGKEIYFSISVSFQGIEKNYKEGRQKSTIRAYYDSEAWQVRGNITGHEYQFRTINNIKIAQVGFFNDKIAIWKIYFQHLQHVHTSIVLNSFSWNSLCVFIHKSHFANIEAFHNFENGCEIVPINTQTGLISLICAIFREILFGWTKIRKSWLCFGQLLTQASIQMNQKGDKL